jgi:hypothetical protein
LEKKNAAIRSLLQGLEFHPENAEIEFRLAGLYYSLNENEKGQYHLVNGLKNDKEFVIILEELFPDILQRPSIKNILKNY